MNHTAEIQSRINDGMNSSQIAVELNTTRTSVMRRVKKEGLIFDARGDELKTMDCIRKRAFEMRPVEAVNWLLDALESVLPSQNPDVLTELRQRLPGLTIAELQLMSQFVGREKGFVFNKVAIFDALYAQRYADGDFPEIKIIDVFVCKLRAKLKRICPQVTIETVWGVGYRLSLDSLFPWESPLV